MPKKSQINEYSDNCQISCKEKIYIFNGNSLISIYILLDFDLNTSEWVTCDIWCYGPNREDHYVDHGSPNSVAHLIICTWYIIDLN